VLFGGGLVGVAILFLWIYCIVDVISTEEALVRDLPKLVWLLIVIFLPTVGSIVWLVLGRPQNAGLKPGDTSSRPPGFRPSGSRPMLGPEDSPDFMSGMDERTRKLRQWEQDLRRREDELRRRKDESD
jgi:hypothetical protein